MALIHGIQEENLAPWVGPSVAVLALLLVAGAYLELQRYKVRTCARAAAPLAAVLAAVATLGGGAAGLCGWTASQHHNQRTNGPTPTRINIPTNPSRR
jgi:hypothetical protein